MIIVKLHGGMGNQMFQYAFGRALSLKHGQSLKFDKRFMEHRGPRDKHFVYRTYDLDIFTLECDFASPSDYRKTGIFFNDDYSAWDRFVKKINYKVHPGFFVQTRIWHDDLLVRASNYFEGYWQTYMYARDIVDTLRKDFTLRESLLSPEVLALGKTMRSEPSVCLNVRCGDFQTNPQHIFTGVQFYSNAYERLKEKTAGDLKVYVFSDDLDWCREHLQVGDDLHFVGHDRAGPKFASYLHLMRSCKYFLIPPSSFAWWAAWLAEDPDKIVIRPEKLSAYDDKIDHTYYMPAEWIACPG